MDASALDFCTHNRPTKRCYICEEDRLFALNFNQAVCSRLASQQTPTLRRTEEIRGDGPLMTESPRYAAGDKVEQGDAVHLPPHYLRFKIEPVKFIVENGLSFWQGNVIKYVCRADAKNGLEDLQKARRYLDMEIKRQEGDLNWNL